jgi:uncharacterized protein YycO
MNLRSKLIQWSIPITKYLGKMHAPFSHKLVTGRDYYNAREILKPGHVLLTRTEGEFSNLMIPGFWTHAAIYDGEERIIEATGAGVVWTDLVTFLMRKDHVAVYRPDFATEYDMQHAADWAERQRGKGYDYEFKGDNEAFYCSELVTAAYVAVMREACPFIARPRLGQLTTIPQDICDAKEKWRMIWRSGQ